MQFYYTTNHNITCSQSLRCYSLFCITGFSSYETINRQNVYITKSTLTKPFHRIQDKYSIDGVYGYYEYKLNNKSGYLMTRLQV